MEECNTSTTHGYMTFFHGKPDDFGVLDAIDPVPPKLNTGVNILDLNDCDLDCIEVPDFEMLDYDLLLDNF